MSKKQKEAWFGLLAILGLILVTCATLGLLFNVPFNFLAMLTVLLTVAVPYIVVFSDVLFGSSK